MLIILQSSYTLGTATFEKTFDKRTMYKIVRLFDRVSGHKMLKWYTGDHIGFRCDTETCIKVKKKKKKETSALI